MPIRDYRQQTRAPGAAAYREASIARAADTSGAEALGRGIQGVAETLERARQTRELGDARLAITEGVGAISAELTEDQDFNTMRPRYGERLDALRDQVLERVSTPALKAQVTNELAAARVSTEARVFRREQEVGGSHARASLMAQLRSASNSMPVASPAQAEDTYTRAMTTIDDLVASGYLTAEEAEAERQRFDEETSTAFVLKAINDDPALAVKGLSDPETAYGLDEVARQRYLEIATRSVDADTRARTNKLENRVEQTRRILETGGTVRSDDLSALRKAAAGTEFGPLLEGSIVAREQLGNFAGATPAEQRAFINSIDEAGIDVDDAATEQAYRRSLDAIHANTMQALATDPVHHAIETGIHGAGALDLGDPESIADRVVLSRELSEVYGAAPRFFTGAEVDHYSTLLNDSAPDDQLALVTTVLDGFGSRAADALNELGGVDPVVDRAGQLVLETGSQRAARTILFGLEAMKAGDELRVPGPDAMEVFMDELGGVMGDLPGGREVIVKAAEAYYAAKAPGRVRASDVNAQVALLSEGLQAAVGQVQINGRAYGGIQDVNGLAVKLPSTLDRRAVTNLLRSASAAHWEAASLSGGLPMQGLGDDFEEVTPAGEVILQWSGTGDVYRVGVHGNRGIEWYSDPAEFGGMFYIDLTTMGEAFLRSGGGVVQSSAAAQRVIAAPAP